MAKIGEKLWKNDLCLMGFILLLEGHTDGIHSGPDTAQIPAKSCVLALRRNISSL